MKSIKVGVCLCLATAWMAGVFTATAASRDFTAEEWLRMPPEDRRLAVTTLVEVLRHRHVSLRQSPDAYAFALEYFLDENPALLARDLKTVFKQMVENHESPRSAGVLYRSARRTE